MTHIVAAVAHLGPAYTGQAIGYRTVRLDKTTVVTAFTTTDVAEAPAGTGSYQVANGVSVHDEGGYIVWGTAGTDVIWGSLPPSPTAAVTTALTSYDAATGADVSALGTASSITVISAIDGDSITVYRSDTWQFTMTLSSLTLTDYEAIGLIVKRNESETDDQSLLYVRSDTGLVRVAGAAPVSSSNGSLTVDSATQLTVLIAIAETNVTPGDYTWWLKTFDTTPNPDKGFTRATGVFTVKAYGLRAVS